MEEIGQAQKTIKNSFKTYDEALIFVKKFEKVSRNDFYVRSSSIGAPSDELTTLENKKIRFPTEDVPHVHVIIGKSYRSCSMGGRSGRKNFRRKSASDQLKTRKRKFVEEDVPVCPAGVTIRSLVIFPELKGSINMTKHAKRRTTEMLRINFSPGMRQEKLFIVEINDNHTSHRKNIQERIDQKVADMMQTLVERGYYSPADISERLKRFVAKMEDCPNTSLPCYSPSIERIRKLAYPLVVKQRNLEREKGFLTDIHEALERMKELEYETETSFVYEGEEDFRNHDVYEACKGKIIHTSADHDLRCRPDTDGVPFIILETRQYECAHGVDYKNKFLIPFTPGQRKHMSKEGMTMCTARCTFRELVLFPGYRIDDSFFAQRGLREKILGRLREDLDQRKAEYEKGVAYAFPTVEEHCGHRVREANGHLFVDEAIKSQINELVEEGVQSLSEMRRHLKMYLKHTFDEDSMPGPFNKRYRPSNQTLMNLMYDAGLPPEDIIQDIRDPVPYISRPSAYRDISTRIEERRKKNEANTAISVIADGENIIETGCDTLLDSLDIFQNIQGSPKVGTRPGLSPSRGHAGNSRASKTEFSEGLFKKQSECQGLLEELLQVVYELTDLFRVRDLHHHLAKVIEFLRAGRLLCDVIPLKKKELADATDSAASGDASAVNIENEGPSTESADEPPTKLLIMDQNDQVTEVELPKDYCDSEIVIYQENNENGEQIYVIPSKTISEENKEKEQEKPATYSRQQRKKEEVRKDMIKVRCHQFFEKDDILKNLNISLHKPSVGRRNLDVSSDVKIEILNQEEEFQRYEREKRNLNLMEIKLRNEEIQLQDFMSEVNTYKVRKPTTVDKVQPAVGTDEDTEMEEMDSATSLHVNMETDVPAGDDEQRGNTSDVIRDHQYFGSSPSKNTSQLQITEDGSGGNVSDLSQTLSTGKQVENAQGENMTAVPDSNVRENESGSIPNSKENFLTVMNDIAKSNSIKEKNKSAAKAASKTASKVSSGSTGQVPTAVSSVNLKPGDTIRFQPNAFNPILNNQCMTGNLIQLNNMIYASTPYGLIPTFGVPVVLHGQGQQLIPSGALVGIPATQAQTSTETQKTDSTFVSNDEQTTVAVVTTSRKPINDTETESNKEQSNQIITVKPLPETSSPINGGNSVTQDYEGNEGRVNDKTQSIGLGINEENILSQGKSREGDTGSTSKDGGIGKEMTGGEKVTKILEKTAHQEITACNKPVAEVSDAHVQKKITPEKCKVTGFRVQIPSLSTASGIVLKTVAPAKSVVPDSPNIAKSPSLKTDNCPATTHPSKQTAKSVKATSPKTTSTIRKPGSSTKASSGQLLKGSNQDGSKEVDTPKITKVPYVKIEKIYKTQLSKEKSKTQKDVTPGNYNSDKSQMDQSRASSKAVEPMVPSPSRTMKTRGRQMKFSKTGEKLQ